MSGTERILVVKLADIGDAVLALPAIQALRDTFPSARIDVLTTEAGANVFRMSDAVNDVITLAKQRFDHIRGLISPGGLMSLAGLTFKLRRRRYDTAVILHHLTTSFGARKFRALVRATGARTVAGLDNGRGDFLTHRAIDTGFGARAEWEYGLEIVEKIGASTDRTRPRLSISDEAVRSARELVERQGATGAFAILHTEVGEFSPARAWPSRHFVDLARELIQSSEMPLVLVGVERRRAEYAELESIPGVINLVGRTSFPELCALVRAASLVIGCDSSVAHLAGAFERPLVTLFGPSNIWAWKPYGASTLNLDAAEISPGIANAVHIGMPCSPCLYKGFRLGRPQGCQLRTCMTAMSPQAVSQIALDTLRYAKPQK